MTAGLHVIEFAARQRPERQVHEVMPTLDERQLLELVDRLGERADLVQ